MIKGKRSKFLFSYRSASHILLKEAHSFFKVNPLVKKEAFIWYWTPALSVPAQIKYISHAKKESKYMTGCEYKHVKYAL